MFSFIEKLVGIYDIALEMKSYRKWNIRPALINYSSENLRYISFILRVVRFKSRQWIAFHVHEIILPRIIESFSPAKRAN